LPDTSKPLRASTPYEYIYKIWTNEPQRFTVHPIHYTMRLNMILGLGKVGEEKGVEFFF
jgi:hypothetical protein